MNPSPVLRRLAALAVAGTAGAIVLTALPSPAAAVPSSGGCAQVSIITARASTEAAGEGITGALVTQVVNASTQTVSRAAVSYPATLNNYNNSSLQGINALKTQLTNLVNSCPSTKVVLMGYSQGAHVVGDVLGGGQGGSLGTATPPIAANISSHVVAVATFGDPRHVASGPNFNAGTSTRNGRFPRSAAQVQRAERVLAADPLVVRRQRHVLRRRLQRERAPDLPQPLPERRRHLRAQPDRRLNHPLPCMQGVPYRRNAPVRTPCRHTNSTT